MGHWRMTHTSKLKSKYEDLTLGERNKDALSHIDLFDAKKSEPNKPAYASPVVLIERMTEGVIRSKQEPEGQRRNVAHFKGKRKPLVLNVGHCETLASFAGSPDPQHWVGLLVHLYVDPNATYPGKNKKGPAIRFKPTRPRGDADTAPLPDVPEVDRARLEAEHDERVEEEPAYTEGQ